MKAEDLRLDSAATAHAKATFPRARMARLALYALAAAVLLSGAAWLIIRPGNRVPADPLNDKVVLPASLAPAFAVSEAWARLPLPGQDIAALYLSITSARDATLVGLRSDAADTVQMHDMTMDGNVMKMRHRASLQLPAGQAVRMQPGGTHLMMQHLKTPLRPGDQIALDLTLVDQGGHETVVRVNAPVRATPPSGS